MKKKKQEPQDLFSDSDENFAFIAGYTSGGFPYGITWEEWDKIEMKSQREDSFAKREEVISPRKGKSV